MSTFVQNFFKRPPIIFPLVALFYVLLSLYMISEWWFHDYLALYKIKPLLVIAFAIGWIATTLFTKWGPIAFIALVSAHAIFTFLIPKDHILGQIFADDFYYTLVPLNLLLCGFILFYYRRISGEKFPKKKSQYYPDTTK